MLNFNSIKMKNIITLLLCLTFVIGSAQDKDTKKADELYQRMAYADAADAYLKLLKRGKGSRYVFEQLGYCYYQINDLKGAATYFKRVVKGRKVNPEVFFTYAQVLKASGNLSEHDMYMNQFAAAKPEDPRAQAFKENPMAIAQMLEAFPAFDAKNLSDINTEYSEFGGTLVGKDFYFTSSRNTTRKKYHWDDQPFLDVYKAELVGNTIKNAKILEGDVNTKYHESGVALSADGKRLYFDRNDYLDGKYVKDENGVNQINLYYSELVNGGWKGVYTVPFNNSEYSVGHPALSPDGKTLYFASDMPGGYGASDLYKVSVNEDGSFGTPENLGAGINTSGKELFPSVDSNGTLYFASNGHMGLGGLDVFKAEAQNGGFGEVQNLGNGANSTGDDFAFVFNPETKSGFVSSNREGGKGMDDIYQVTPKVPPCDVIIDVLVVNAYTDEPLFGARVSLGDGSSDRLSTIQTSEAGTGQLMGACNTALTVSAQYAGFEPETIDIDPSGNASMNKTLKLKPVEAIIVDDKIELETILFDYNKSDIKPQAAFELDRLVEIMKKYPKLVVRVESHSDTQGDADYNRALSDRRAQATVQYVIDQGIDAMRISGQGFGEDQPVVDCGDNCTEEDHEKNRRSEFIIVNE